MCDTIYPVVSVGSVESDVVGEVLPVTIRLDPETWDMLTDHLYDCLAFGMSADMLPPSLGERIRSFIETMLVNEMAARDYLLEEASGSGA